MVSTVVQKTATTTPEQCCPECQGDAREEGAERVCSECGLVLEADAVDTGPEWRGFGDDLVRRQSIRVGPARTERRHNKGLGSEIGEASPSERKQLHGRVRQLARRTWYTDSRERYCADGLGEVQRICSALDLTGDVVDRACRIWTEAHDASLADGRTIDSVAAASVLAAAREHHYPVLIADVLDVAAVTRELLMRVYQLALDETSAEFEIVEPIAFVERVCDTLGLDTRTTRRTRELTSAMQDVGVHAGRNPISVVAAAAYIASKSYLTQADISDAIDISPNTIRNVRDAAREAGVVEEVFDDAD